MLHTYHQITPRGALTTSLRSLQDTARRQRLARVPGVRLRITPHGTYAIPLATKTKTTPTPSVVARWA